MLQLLGTLGRADRARARGLSIVFARRLQRAASKTAATVEVAVLAGRGNRPHPSTPRGRPKRCRVGVFPPTVHESGTAPPDELSSAGRGRARPNTIMWTAPRA